MDGPSPSRKSIDSLSSDDPELFDRLEKSRSEGEYDTSSSDESDSTDAISPPRMRAEQKGGRAFDSGSVPRGFVVTKPAALSNSSGRAPDTYASDSDGGLAQQRMGRRNPVRRQLSEGSARARTTGAAAREARTGAGPAPTSTAAPHRAVHSRSQSRSQKPSLWPKGTGASSGSEADARPGSGSDGESVNETGGGSGRYSPYLPPIESTGMSPAMDEMAAEKKPPRSPTAGAFSEKRDWNIRDLLVVSIENDDFETLEGLVKGGFVDPHAPRNSDLRTPLMMTIERSEATLKAIASLKKGRDRHLPRHKTEKLDGEIDRYKMQSKIAKLLIKHARPEQLQAQDIDGHTALMLAIIHGVDHIVKRLLRFMSQEQLKIRNRLGQNALLLALDRHRIPATRYLLAAGADVPNANGHTALLAAIAAENSARLDVLIKAGVMINQTGPKHATPLSMAIRKGNVQLVKTLLELGAHADQSNPQADVPLMIAARCGNLQIVTELLENGASAQRSNPARIGALHIAAKYGHVKVMALLMDHGADVNAQDRYGVAPLHAAAYFGHVEAAQLLINNGASLECVDQHGCTPLHYAARFGGGDCCKLLISRGADIYATDRVGTGVLVKARMADDPESYAALLCAFRRNDNSGGGCVLI